MLYFKNRNYDVETVVPNASSLIKPVSDKDYLYFQAVEDGASVMLKSPSSFNVSFEISQDGANWNTWNKTAVGIYDVFEKTTLSKRGDYVFIRATDLNVWQASDVFYMYFQLGYKKMACGGKITSMITKDAEFDNISTYTRCFYKLFYSCTSLVTPPELPATTLANYCYVSMFQGCVSLTTVPALPATTLANYCYVSMFQGCVSLTTAPALPATTLGYMCCQNMFAECTSLTTAPELPATNLASASFCYSNMFKGCTSLTTAPALPATTLANNCYSAMFYGCTALTTAPALPATTLANNCYHSMFYECTSLTSGCDMQKASVLSSSCCVQMYLGCKSLTSAWTPNVSSWTSSYFSNWLSNVASAGTLYKPSNLENIPLSDPSGVPVGWSTETMSQTVTLSASGLNTYGFSYSVGGVSYTLANGQTTQVILTHPQGISITTTNPTDYIEVDGTFKQLGTTVELTYEDLSNGSVVSCRHVSDENLLSFTAQEAGSTIGMQHNGTNTGATKPVIYFSADNKNTFTLWDYSTITLSNVGDTVYMYGINPNGVGRNSSNYSQFTMSGKISANGDCTALIYPKGTTSIPFGGLYNLFKNCASLTTAPELPSTTLADYCYGYMFYGCTSLTTAPALPAKTLANYCYQQMFYGCTSLTTAPELPATTLVMYCYFYMFNGCTSLTTAPELPATTLASQCYERMFYGCTKLNYIKVGATSWNTNYATNWVSNVASSGVFIKPQGTEIPYGVDGVPEGWYATDSETKTITLSAVESDCYGFSYKVNNGSVQTLPNGQTSEITITPQDTLEIMTNDVNNFRCVFLGGSVVGFGSGCTIDMRYGYYGDTITCKDPTFDKCLEFKAVSASTTIGMQHYGTNTGTTKPVIYVSEGNKTNWRLWDYSNITLANIDDVVYMFGCNIGGLSNSDSNYSQFSTNKNVLLSGSVNSLINVIGEDDVLKPFAFCKLFSNTALTTAPTLQSTILASYCYRSMFNGCTGLTTAPTLPATTLADYCYQNMFYGCTSLTTAPTLPATTLADYCYLSMFGNCTSLATAPALPATTLAYACYSVMFNGCTKLTTAPALPAKTLANYCYQQMFYGCTSLTAAPALPATTLASYCYFYMFYGCTSLTTAPALPATTLAYACYSYMFYGCTSLNYIKVGATSWNTNYATNWVSNVASSGTLYKSHAASIPTNNASGVPTGWNAIDYDGPLTFTANTAGSTIGMTHNGTNASSTKPVIYISTDDGQNWSLWDYTTITLTNVGDKVMMYGDNPNGISRGLEGYSSFTMSGSVSASKDCTTLITQAGTRTVPQYCFFGLFMECTSLTTAPDLPARTLANNCYYFMFINCTSLETAPELPATTLAVSCYANMFNGCTSLTAAPELPATTLADYCYQQMFFGCTSMTTAPELPATTLADSCYYSMFNGCTSLETAPELPATTLASRCCSNMFRGCTSLTVAPELPATTLAVSCYANMFNGCTSLTAAPELPATTLADSCYYSMFNGCTSLNYVKVWAVSWNTSATIYWLSDVAATGTFTKPSATTIPSGTDGIPNGWTVMNL